MWLGASLPRVTASSLGATAGSALTDLMYGIAVCAILIESSRHRGTCRQGVLRGRPSSERVAWGRHQGPRLFGIVPELVEMSWKRGVR